MIPSSDLPKRKRFKDIVDVTTNVVVVVFALVAIGVLVKSYFAPQGVKTSVAVRTGSIFPEIPGSRLQAGCPHPHTSAQCGLPVLHEECSVLQLAG